MDPARGIHPWTGGGKAVTPFVSQPLAGRWLLVIPLTNNAPRNRDRAQHRARVVCAEPGVGRLVSNHIGRRGLRSVV